MKSHTANKTYILRNWKLILASCSLFGVLGCSLAKEQPTPPVIKDTSNKTYSSDDLAVQPKPVIQEKSHPQNFLKCGHSEKSRLLAQLIVNDSEQLRPVILCDAHLAEIAYQKAKEMALNGKVSHKGSYFGPNQRLISYGYPLDSNEHELFNTVEAVMGGEEDAAEVWLSFQSSYPHKVHLLGEDAFYTAQTQLGVGYYKKKQSPHVDYWAVYFVRLDKN